MLLNARYEVRATVTQPDRPPAQELLLAVSGSEAAESQARAVYARAVRVLLGGEPGDWAPRFWTEVILEGPNGLFERVTR